jgi:hypothetical protein
MLVEIKCINVHPNTTVVLRRTFIHLFLPAKLMIRRQYQHTAVGGVYTLVGIAGATFEEES